MKIQHAHYRRIGNVLAIGIHWGDRYIVASALKCELGQYLQARSVRLVDYRDAIKYLRLTDELDGDAPTD